MMDISSLKTKYQSLYNEVQNKGQLLKGFDESDADSFSGKGDLFIRECSLQSEGAEPSLFSGRVAFDPASGNCHIIDIEEKTANGASMRYRFEKTENDGAAQSVLLKKTDTLKLKATVTEKTSAPPEVILEEMQFVEAALAPEIDSKSENVKKTVLQTADSLAFMDNSDSDADKTPGTISLDNFRHMTPDGQALYFTGRIVKDQQGPYRTIELTATDGENPRAEYYFSQGQDFDFYKITGEDTMESTQIFEKGGPRLVLFSEERRFTL